MIQAKQGNFKTDSRLLGRPKNGPIELSPIGNNNARYMDIFNSTVVIYEDLKTKCKIKLSYNLYSQRSNSGAATEDYAKV